MEVKVNFIYQSIKKDFKVNSVINIRTKSAVSCSVATL